MAGNTVLVVEDDQTLLGVLKYNLSKEGYQVIAVCDGEEAIAAARAQKPDLVILDIMLPKMDGFEVCRILRKELTAPIVMLTAKTEEIDKVVGLEIGADDYVTKPFSMRELLARVKAMLRRTERLNEHVAQEVTEDTASVIKVGDLEVDMARHRVSLGGSALDVSPKEFDLLAFLVANRGHVFSRDDLLERVWGYDYAGGTRTVDVHVRWLRRKMEADPAHPTRLLTVRGVGYKYEA